MIWVILYHGIGINFYLISLLIIKVIKLIKLKKMSCYKLSAKKYHFYVVTIASVINLKNMHRAKI
jgi:hypothetical protein